MKTYLFSILMLNVFIGGICYLASNSPRIGQLRYICSLVMMVALLAPLVSIFRGDISIPMPEGPDLSDGNYTAYLEELKKESEKTLAEDYTAGICQKTGLTEDDLSLSFCMTVNENKLDISQVRVVLRSVKAVYQREKIRKLLADFDGELVFIEDLS